jgi:stage V sporulation protein B
LYGLGVSAIPQISNLSSSEKAKQKAFNILSINLILALPISIITYFSSDLIVRLLFGGLSVQEKIIVSELIKLTSVNIVFLSFVQTSNSILIGKGKLYKPVISLLIGIIIKTVLEIVLLNNVRINIYGAVIGSIACYFVVSLVNLKLINEVGKERAKLKVKDKRYIA